MQQSSWKSTSNACWPKVKMQNDWYVLLSIFSAFALLFGNHHHLYYLQALSKNIRACLLFMWGCMSLLLNCNKSSLFLYQFFVNLSSKKFKLAENWASLPAMGIAWKLRVLRAWSKKMGCFSLVLYLPALHVMYSLFWLCCVFTSVFLPFFFILLAPCPITFPLIDFKTMHLQREGEGKYGSPYIQLSAFW